MTMETDGVSRAVVLRGRDKYEDWRNWMEIYLLAQGLWDIVDSVKELPEQQDDKEPPKQEDDKEPPKQRDDKEKLNDWGKRNAAALLAIHLSCEKNVLSKMKKISSVKEVWNKLAKEYGPSLDVEDDPGTENHIYRDCRALCQAIKKR